MLLLLTSLACVSIGLFVGVFAHGVVVLFFMAAMAFASLAGLFKAISTAKYPDSANYGLHVSMWMAMFVNGMWAFCATLVGIQIR